MKRIGKAVAFFLILKFVLLLIAKGFTLELLEKFNENNNKL